MARVAAVTGTEIRVLGPVELWRDGEPVHLGGPRQHALLVLLAFRANEVLSSHLLVEELFGAEASEKSANAIHAAVSRLRRLLEPGALETRGRGYVLHLEMEQLDSTLFERLLAEGRAQLAGGDAATAASTLRDALSLWRGPTLGGLAAPESVQAGARRLEELRVVGLMDRIEAELDLGAAQELVPELETLVAENPLRERLRGQLMLALYRCGRQADALTVYRETHRLLREELGLEPGRALQDLERAILRQDKDLEPAATGGEPVVLCPFKGLAPFTTGDAAYYFGRERVVDEAIARLVDHPFLGLVGSSGSGKSSLLQAGVLTALAGGALPGSTAWRRALVRPGAHPLSTLPDSVDVLAVDQLEEAFTICRDDDERAGFFSELARRARDGTVVLVALRADFYGRCAAFPEFAALLSSNHLLLGAMHRDELAHAIEGPAERAGLQAERELVDLVVGDVAGEPGALPLLSTTLVELWRRRAGRVLTAASYRESGGVRGAVARLAEQAFGQLNEREQRAARVVMLRLADEEDGAIVRRRVPIEELDTASDADVARVVGVLTEARLLTVAEGTVEVSHETLLTEWPRLRGWLDEDRVGRRLRAHLAASAREWDERGREPGDLYRGPRLAAALDWSTDHGDELNAVEREFLGAARTEQEREVAEQRRRNRRLRTALVGAVVLLVIAVAAGVVAVQKGQTASHEARVELAGQLGDEAVVEPRIDRAMLLARESVNLDRSTQTEGTLLATLLRTPAIIGTFTMPIEDRPQYVKVSTDGRDIAVVTNSNIMRVFDSRTHRQTRQFPAAKFVYSYVPKSGDLLVNDARPIPDLLLVDPRTGRTLRSFTITGPWVTEATSPIEPLVISRDGRYAFFLYAAGPQGTERAYMEVWRLDHGGRSQVVKLDGSGMIAAAALPGDRVSVAMNGRVSVWDGKRLKRVSTVPGPRFNPGQAVAAALSPDGHTLAYGFDDGTVHFRDIANMNEVTGIGGHAAGVTSIVFSPDSRTAVSTGDDGMAIVWDPTSGRPTERLTGHVGKVLASDFSPDGKTLYTAGLDGTVLQYDLGRGNRFGAAFSLHQSGTPAGPGSLLPQSPLLAVSPNGRLFAASGVNFGTVQSTVEFYSASTPQLRRVTTIVLPKNRAVGAAAWAGTHFLLGADRGLVQMWDIAGSRPRPVRIFQGLSTSGQVRAVATAEGGLLVAAADGMYGPPDPNGFPAREGQFAIWRDGKLIGKPLKLQGFAHAVALSPGGGLAAVSADAPPGGPGHLLIVDAQSGRPERTITVPRANGSLTALAFAPDGELATGTQSGIVNLWNPKTGRAVGHSTLVAPAPVASIAFSPDGTTFATSGGSSGGARIWVTATQQQLGSDFPGGDGQWGNLAYTPDGRYLLVVFGDGTADRWPVSVRAWEDQACAVAGRNLTREEWARYVPRYPYTRICRGT